MLTSIKQHPMPKIHRMKLFKFVSHFKFYTGHKLILIEQTSVANLLKSLIFTLSVTVGELVSG